MEDQEVARTVLRALGRDVKAIDLLGTGFASQAWRVDLDDAVGVLRVAVGGPHDGASAGSTYEMEHELMGRLEAAGAPVPHPIAGDWDISTWTGAPFSLTSHVPGIHLAARDRDRAVRPLAAFVVCLESLRVPGFGPLVTTHGELVAADREVGAGLIRWAERPLWPLDGHRLDEDPVLAGRPAIAAGLARHATVVRAALLGGEAGVVHSDLHEENILVEEGRLCVIDFGEALVGPLAWEFASVAYFSDWVFADAIVDAATSPDKARRRRLEATRIALAFGLYRWHQDREMSLQQDEYNASFLERTLSRLET